MKLTGTIGYRDLEGALWELAADDGKTYTLLGSKMELRAAKGQRVEVEGSLDEGFGVGMSGPQLKVEKLRRL